MARIIYTYLIASGLFIKIRSLEFMIYIHRMMLLRLGRLMKNMLLTIMIRLTNYI